MDNSTNYKLYRNKDFLLLMQGKFVSNLGTSIHNVAVIWYIISFSAQSKAGFNLALFSIFTFIPLVILGPISGVYVDRINRKLIIVGSDILCGLLILLLAVFTIYEIKPFLNLIIISALCSVLSAFFNPAVSATLPNIVDSENLVKANSYNGMIFRITMIVGAALAGYLFYKIGIVGIFLLNGISFILSGISELFIHIPKLKRKINDAKKHFWNEFKEGIFFIKNDKTLLLLLSYFLLARFLVIPINTIILPQIIKFSLHLTAVELGRMEAIYSIGALIGMIIISRIPDKSNIYRKSFIYCIISRPILLLLFGCAVLPFILSTASNYGIYYFLCLCGFITMAISPLITIPIHTSFQKRTPDEMRGRFYSIFNTASMSIVPLSNLLVGLISDSVNFSTIIITVAIMEVVLVLVVIKLVNFKDLFFYTQDK